MTVDPWAGLVLMTAIICFSLIVMVWITGGPKT
jgi:hypothetical protein